MPGADPSTSARLHGQPELRWQSLLSTLDSFFDPLLAIFIFLAILLPGSPHGINVKYPLYAVLIPLAFLRCFERGLATPRHLIAMLGILTSLSFWIIVALFHHFETPSIIRQFTDILLTIMVCWFVRLAWLGDTESCLRFLRLVVNASLATAAAKLGLIIYALLRGIPIVEMVLQVDSLFGVELMTMNLGDLLGRFQLIADELIPICIFIVLRYRDRLNFSSWRASLTILILIISVLFSFSRYFWVFTLITFIMGLLMGKRDRFQAGSYLSALRRSPRFSADHRLRLSIPFLRRGHRRLRRAAHRADHSLAALLLRSTDHWPWPGELHARLAQGLLSHRPILL